MIFFQDTAWELENLANFQKFQSISIHYKRRQQKVSMQSLVTKLVHYFWVLFDAKTSFNSFLRWCYNGMTALLFEIAANLIPRCFSVFKMVAGKGLNKQQVMWPWNYPITNPLPFWIHQNNIFGDMWQLFWTLVGRCLGPGWRAPSVNPLSPKSDQCQNSAHDINVT